MSPTRSTLCTTVPGFNLVHDVRRRPGSVIRSSGVQSQEKRYQEDSAGRGSNDRRRRYHFALVLAGYFINYYVMLLLSTVPQLIDFFETNRKWITAMVPLSIFSFATNSLLSTSLSCMDWYWINLLLFVNWHESSIILLNYQAAGRVYIGSANFRQDWQILTHHENLTLQSLS